MPLVLVHNEVVNNPAHAWNDVEGVHYPVAKYAKKPDPPFTYFLRTFAASERK
jgi:hypothetical protein